MLENDSMRLRMRCRKDRSVIWRCQRNGTMGMTYNYSREIYVSVFLLTNSLAIPLFCNGTCIAYCYVFTSSTDVGSRAWITYYLCALSFNFKRENLASYQIWERFTLKLRSFGREPEYEWSE